MMTRDQVSSCMNSNNDQATLVTRKVSSHVKPANMDITSSCGRVAVVAKNSTPGTLYATKQQPSRWTQPIAATSRVQQEHSS